METPFCKIVVSDQVDPNTAILISPHQFRGDLSDWDSMIKQWLAETGMFCVIVNLGEPECKKPGSES